MFGPSVNFLPIRKPFPQFKLHLCHLFPADFMKTLAAVDVERSFEITYDEEDIEDEVQAMEFIKRTRDKVELLNGQQKFANNM